MQSELEVREDMHLSSLHSLRAKYEAEFLSFEELQTFMQLEYATLQANQAGLEKEATRLKDLVDAAEGNHAVWQDQAQWQIRRGEEDCRAQRIEDQSQSRRGYSSRLLRYTMRGLLRGSLAVRVEVWHASMREEKEQRAEVYSTLLDEMMRRMVYGAVRLLQSTTKHRSNLAMAQCLGGWQVNLAVHLNSARVPKWGCSGESRGPEVPQEFAYGRNSQSPPYDNPTREDNPILLSPPADFSPVAPSHGSSPSLSPASFTMEEISKAIAFAKLRQALVAKRETLVMRVQAAAVCHARQTQRHFQAWVDFRDLILLAQYAAEEFEQKSQSRALNSLRTSAKRERNLDLGGTRTYLAQWRSSVRQKASRRVAKAHWLNCSVYRGLDGLIRSGYGMRQEELEMVRMSKYHLTLKLSMAARKWRFALLHQHRQGQCHEAAELFWVERCLKVSLGWWWAMRRHATRQLTQPRTHQNFLKKRSGHTGDASQTPPASSSPPDLPVARRRNTAPVSRTALSLSLTPPPRAPPGTFHVPTARIPRSAPHPWRRPSGVSLRAASTGSGGGLASSLSAPLSTHSTPRRGVGGRIKKRPAAPTDVASLRRIMRRRHVSTGQLFSYMDSDRSDTITLKEFEHGIAMSGVRPMPNAAQIQGLFESFDLNGDGSLSWHEVIWRLEEEDTLSSEEGSAGEAEEEEEESICQ